MSLFKKKIKFVPFLKEIIAIQFDFWEKNFALLIDLADEAKILTDSEKQEFKDKMPELIIADIVLACSNHLGEMMPIEDVATFTGTVYELYLMQCRSMSKAAVGERSQRVNKFRALLSQAERKSEEHDAYRKKIGYEPPYRIKGADRMKLSLCQAFSTYCIGEDMRSANYLERSFAAFKLAKALVQGDIVGRALKEYAITFR